MRQVALRGLRARSLRTVLTAFSIVLGVAMIAGTYVLTDTIDTSFSETFQQANSGTDVVVSPKQVDAAFEESAPPLPDDLVERVRKVDGVAAAAGAIRDDVSIRDARGDRLVVLADGRIAHDGRAGSADAILDVMKGLRS